MTQDDIDTARKCLAEMLSRAETTEFVTNMRLRISDENARFEAEFKAQQPRPSDWLKPYDC